MNYSVKTSLQTQLVIRRLIVILIQRFNYKSKWNKIVLYICITNNIKIHKTVYKTVFRIKSAELLLNKLPWSYWGQNVYSCVDLAWNAFPYQKVTWNRWTLLSLHFWWNCSGRK